MEDNLSLSESIKARYRGQYTGVFYRRYILGEWCLAEGLVYPQFSHIGTAPSEDRAYSRYVISMDYGIQNPTAMLLWGKCGETWYQVDEFYHSGRDSGHQKTDQEYYEDLCRLAGDRAIDCLIIDPSATSFIALVRQQHRFRVRQAKNEVADGIQKTASALQTGKIKVCENCRKTIQEYGLYSWDPKAQEDRVLKTHDHAMDATRYFVATMGIMKPQSDYKPLWN